VRSNAALSLWPEAVEAALDKELGPGRPLHGVQPLYLRVHFLVHVVVNVSRTETRNKLFTSRPVGTKNEVGQEGESNFQSGTVAIEGCFQIELVV
jgi:hypothetical protein